MAIVGWLVVETGVWVPAFAGMTEGARVTGWGVWQGVLMTVGCFHGTTGLVGCGDGAWVPGPDLVEGRPFAGMTEGAGVTGS